jgi:hypothetical protein
MDTTLNAFERFVERFTGPMHARFIVQPVMATILGIRDGMHDAREGRTPFFQELCTRPETRRLHLRKAIQRLMTPLVIAIVLDGVVQYLLFQRVHVMGAVIIGVSIMGVPYTVARGLTNRIVSARNHRRLHPRPGRG